MCVCVCVHALSCVWFFATTWTVAYQAPLSLGLSRQEYWRGLPFPSPEDLPDQGLNLGLLHCRQFLYPLSYREDPLHSISIILQYKIKTKLKRNKLSSKLTMSLHISTSIENSVCDNHCYSCNTLVVFLFYPLIWQFLQGLS